MSINPGPSSKQTPNPFLITSAMGVIAASPAPTYDANGNLLTATIDRHNLVCTYDANNNLALKTYDGYLFTYTWAIQGDGNFHLSSVTQEIA